jgi:hypothetical protein
MKLALIILCLSACAFAQDDERHSSAIERFEHLRVLPPAVIEIATDGRSLKATVVEKLERLDVTLDIDDHVRAPQVFGSDRKKLWWIYYCDEHKTLAASRGTAVIIVPYERLRIDSKKELP